MAAPLYQTTGTYSQTSGGSPATSIIVSAPASIAAGDLLQLHLTLDNASATVNSVPSGWTQAGGSPVIINTGGNQQNVVYYKWATGSEPGTYTFGFSASTFAEGAILRISGSVGSGSPYDGTPATATNPSSGSTSTPGVSLTTTGPDRLITHAYTKVNSGAFTPNAGYTTRVSGGFNTLGASTITQTSAGSTGTVQATKATTDQSTAWLGAILPQSTSVAWLQSPRRLRPPMLVRAGRVRVFVPPPAGGAVPQQVPHRVRLPVARRRPCAATPVRAQVNPPYPPGFDAQPRRFRAELLRRDRVQSPPWPAATPPVNPDWIAAPRRIHPAPLLLRRNHVWSPPWPAQTAPANPAWAQGPRRPRVLLELLRRDRVASPPWPAPLSVPPSGRRRPVLPAGRRRRLPVLVLAAAAVVNPPYTPAPPRRRPQLLLVRRRRRWFAVPLEGAEPVCTCTTTRPFTGITSYSGLLTTRPDAGITARPCTCT